MYISYTDVLIHNLVVKSLLSIRLLAGQVAGPRAAGNCNDVGTIDVPTAFNYVIFFCIDTSQIGLYILCRKILLRTNIIQLR